MMFHGLKTYEELTECQQGQARTLGGYTEQRPQSYLYGLDENGDVDRAFFKLSVMGLFATHNY